MWSGSLVHVRKVIRITLSDANDRMPCSITSNAISPHHSVDFLHLSFTFPFLTAGNLSSTSQT